MQIKLPPIKMISIEREVKIFSIVSSVRQNIASTFCEAQEYVSGIKIKMYCYNTMIDEHSIFVKSKSQQEQITLLF